MIDVSFEVFFLALTAGWVFLVASVWALFEKVGEPGWAVLVPIYNVYVLTCRVAGKSEFWFILALIPIANIVAALPIVLEVARKFEKSELFGVGMWLLPFVFVPILAFGDAAYADGEEGDGRTSRSDVSWNDGERDTW
jgi:hypothetical protein